MAHAAVIQPYRFLQHRFSGWVARRHPAAEREITLHRRRIYILPNRYGYVFAALLFVMLLGALNYGNSMAFALTFLLASLALNTLWHTQRNLLGLCFVKGKARPVFAGETARLQLSLRNHSRRTRYDVALRWRRQRPVVTDVTAGEDVVVELGARTGKRGWLRPGRFRVETHYPLGLFQAWSWLEFDLSVLVYPRPADSAPPLPDGIGGDETGGNVGPGRDDYAGLREYRPGDSPRHIAWKALARSDELLAKQFSGGSGATCWLDWDRLSGLDPEARLSILCRWVLDAHARWLRFGLQLPGQQIVPDRGEPHFRRCLRALALYGLTDEDGH